MTVLYLNNYACDKEIFALVEQHKYPKCHLWGAYELYHKTGVNLIIPDISVPAFENSSASRIIRLLKLLLFQAKIFLKYNKKVDCVYSACGHLTDVFACAKRLKLYRGDNGLSSSL
ncbi:MAG: hypothetical protein K2N31_00280 [Treponemataceae bacterium]|nr:hypothetical protein [Treponemataceae bacterium]